MSHGHHFQGQKVKGQLAGGGGILWRPSAQLVLFHLFWDTHTDLHWILAQTFSLNVPDRFVVSARIHRGFVHQFSTRCTWQHVNVDSIILNYQASGFVYSFNVNYFVLPCYVQLITAKTDLLNAWFIFYQIRLLAFFVAITHYWVWTDLFHSPDCCLLSCWVKFHDSCWYDLGQVGEVPKLYKIHLHHNGRKWRKLHPSSQILHLTESNFFQ